MMGWYGGGMGPLGWLLEKTDGDRDEAPLTVVALVAAVTALVGSAAIAVGTLGGQSSGPTMMGGHGQGSGSGMMGGSVMGGSMMGGSVMGAAGSVGMMVWPPGDGVVVPSIPAARTRAATAARPAGLHPGEVIWFDNGFYVDLKDGTGNPATEVIVDPRTGAVSTEPGPAMMWNTRFGRPVVSQDANTSAGAVDATKARAIATAWLAANRAGTAIGNVDAYPGYFTVDLKRDGVVSAMMSVSSSSGAAWYHTWHGAFIALEDS